MTKMYIQKQLNVTFCSADEIFFLLAIKLMTFIFCLNGTWQFVNCFFSFCVCAHAHACSCSMLHACSHVYACMSIWKANVNVSCLPHSHLHCIYLLILRQSLLQNLELTYLLDSLAGKSKRFLFFSLFTLALRIHISFYMSRKLKYWGRRASSAVKGAGSSPREPEFGFQHPCHTTYNCL